jgi:hypothetical protein
VKRSNEALSADAAVSFHGGVFFFQKKLSGAAGSAAMSVARMYPGGYIGNRYQGGED